MTKSKNNLTYGSDKLGYQMSFEDFNGNLAGLSKLDRSMYQEALDRFASKFIQALEKRDSHSVNAGTPNHGVAKLIELLRSDDVERPIW